MNSSRAFFGVASLILMVASACMSAAPTPDTGSTAQTITSSPNTTTTKPNPTPIASQPNQTTGGSSSTEPNAKAAPDPNRPETGPTERFLGRFDSSNPNVGAVFNWPGSAIFTRFVGRDLDITLTAGDTFTYQGQKVTSVFDVFIDGQKTSTFSLVPTSNRYTIAKNFPSGDHYVQVFKRTEPQMGTASFGGFIAGGNTTLMPAPSALSRRIEFIGDSITAGYGSDGNVATYAGCPNFTLATENAGSTFASITAANLAADFVAVAWSGKGILQNDDCYGDPSNTIPDLYSSTAPLVTDSTWDFTSWVPQAVVINLGTNDYNMNNGCAAPASAAFSTAWLNFIKVVRGHYPDAYILATVGPELHPPNLAKAQAAIASAVATLNSAGESRVAYVALAEDTGANGYGCGGHPNKTTHTLMASVVTQALKKALNW